MNARLELLGLAVLSAVGPNDARRVQQKGTTMQIKLPTDLEPTAGIQRPDQQMTTTPAPMPTLADFGVRVRSGSAAAATSAGVATKRGK